MKNLRFEEQVDETRRVDGSEAERKGTARVGVAVTQCIREYIPTVLLINTFPAGVRNRYRINRGH